MNDDAKNRITVRVIIVECYINGRGEGQAIKNNGLMITLSNNINRW